MAFFKDYSELPEPIQRGDYELRLSEGITDLRDAARVRGHAQVAGLFRQFPNLPWQRCSEPDYLATFLHSSFGSIALP